MFRIGRVFYPVCRNRIGHAFVRQMVAACRRLGGFQRFRLPFDALDLDHNSFVGLTDLWSRIHWSAGDGMMPPKELLAIYRLAASWPVNGDVVELGSWVGETTCYLAAACQVRGQGKVYAVDTFAGTKEGGTRYSSIARHGGSTMAAFDERIARARVENIVEKLVGYTTEMPAKYPGGPVRLLLIDADHSYQGVSSDFERWWPYVAPGGLIIFHDYLMPEVARFVDDDIRRSDACDATPGAILPNVMVVTKRV